MFKKSDSSPAGIAPVSTDAADSKSPGSEPAFMETSAKYGGSDRKGTPAMIGASIRVKGELYGEEDLVIQGHVEGTIEVKKNNLTVGAQGAVKANVRARIITVEGKVEGDLHGEERIVIRQSGDVRGNIVAPRVSLDDGAKFKGSIDMEPKAGKGNSPTLEPVSNAGSARPNKDAHAGGPHAKTA
jgi:cytoskeletal protein CcmA (bactofilin family)